MKERLEAGACPVREGRTAKEDALPARLEAARVCFERRREGRYVVSDDQARLDVAAIHRYLSEESYWSAGIPEHVLEKAIANSLCLGVYDGETQVGFSRIVTDRATFAWLCDVYVLEEYRGRGLARWMLEAMLEHPDLQGLRRIVLATRDAHRLYSTVGFVALPQPERWMVIADPNAYAKAPRNA